MVEITEKELIEICDRMMHAADSGDYMGGIRQLAKDMTVNIVPEPTNADKIEQLILDATLVEGRTAMTGFDAVRAWAEYLDANGVEAGN